MNSKSQMGQDKILDQQIFNGKKNGVFVEVGALDGICGSNTYFFEKERSWTGLLIEPNPIEFKKLEKIDRELSIKENCAISNEEGDINFLSIEGPCNVLSGILEFYNENHLSRINRELESYKSYEEGHELYSKSETIKMKALKLQTLFDKYNLVDIDLISIDVEGAEMNVLESIDYTKTNITCFLIENNYGIEKETEFLTNKGYKFVGNIEWDCVFIKDTNKN
jgi:FkbM family methyltransferase